MLIAWVTRPRTRTSANFVGIYSRRHDDDATGRYSSGSEEVRRDVGFRLDRQRGPCLQNGSGTDDAAETSQMHVGIVVRVPVPKVVQQAQHMECATLMRRCGQRLERLEDAPLRGRCDVAETDPGSPGHVNPSPLIP
jgi:hypothetical protein